MGHSQARRGLRKNGEKSLVTRSKKSLLRVAFVGLSFLGVASSRAAFAQHECVAVNASYTPRLQERDVLDIVHDITCTDPVTGKVYPTTYFVQNGAGGTPGAPTSSFQINNGAGGFAGSTGLLWDSVNRRIVPGTALTLSQNIAATSLANTDSPQLTLRAEYWDGISASLPDTWYFFSQIRPINSTNTRSTLLLNHSGTIGSSNGSNWNFSISGDNSVNGCEHDDISGFSVNSTQCLSFGAANTAGTGGDFDVYNSALSGSGRTRIIQKGSAVNFFHATITDPNNTATQDWGMRGCIPLTCWDEYYVLYTGGTPEMYLGGAAAGAGTGAAAKVDIGAGRQGWTFYGAVVGSSTSTLDYSASSVLTGFKPPAATGANPTVQGVIAFDKTTNQLRCGNGTTTTRCQTTMLTGGGGATQPNLSSTQFGKLSGGSSIAGTTEISVRQLLVFAGTLTNFCVTTTSTQSATGSLVFTIKDSTAGSSAGALTVTFGAGQTATTICDNSNADTVVATHDYAVQIVNNATVAGATVEGWGTAYNN